MRAASTPPAGHKSRSVLRSSSYPRFACAVLWTSWVGLALALGRLGLPARKFGHRWRPLAAAGALALALGGTLLVTPPQSRWRMDYGLRRCEECRAKIGFPSPHPIERKTRGCTDSLSHPAGPP